MKAEKPIAARNISPTSKRSLYPAPFAAKMEGRIKRKLGDYYSLTNFGVNLTELEPGAMSALKHHHREQDEFVYVLSGTPTLVFGEETHVMQPGDCFGFKKGEGVGHQLVNESGQKVTYLEIGDRSPGDRVEYPDEDLCAKSEQDGSWSFLHKDGTPY